MDDDILKIPVIKEGQIMTPDELQEMIDQLNAYKKADE